MFVLSVLAYVAVQAKTTFTIGGPDAIYNQIRIINNTSQSNFSCRLVRLTQKEDGSFERGEVYGVYRLKGADDIDTNTSWVERGTIMGLEMPADFPVDVETTIVYKRYPFFVSVLVTLTDKNGKFETF